MVGQSEHGTPGVGLLCASVSPRPPVAMETKANHRHRIGRSIWFAFLDWIHLPTAGRNRNPTDSTNIKKKNQKLGRTRFINEGRRPAIEWPKRVEFHKWIMRDRIFGSNLRELTENNYFYYWSRSEWTMRYARRSTRHRTIRRRYHQSLSVSVFLLFRPWDVQKTRRLSFSWSPSLGHKKKPGNTLSNPIKPGNNPWNPVKPGKTQYHPVKNPVKPRKSHRIK